MVGPPGTIDLATITTLAVGAAPTAVVTGTPANRKLELGWPAIADSQIASAFGATLHVAQTPPASPVKFGLPVLWVDTRDPASWPPAAPTKNEAARTITIPNDEGAIYRVSGAEKAPGVYTVAVGTTWTVTAHARTGYVLAGSNSWSITVTGVSNLNALAALITEDAPTTHLTLSGSNPLQDVGSAPRTWTATAPIPKGEWGSVFTIGGGSVNSTPATPFVSGGLTAFTVEAVLEPKGVSGQHSYAGVISSSNMFQLGVGYNRALTANARNSSNVTAGGTWGVVPQEATHVAMVLSDGTLTGYVDGVAVGSQAVGSTYAATNETVVLGVGAALNAELGQFAFYRGKALTSARILQHAQAVGA